MTTAEACFWSQRQENSERKITKRGEAKIMFRQSDVFSNIIDISETSGSSSLGTILKLPQKVPRYGSWALQIMIGRNNHELKKNTNNPLNDIWKGKKWMQWCNSH